MNFRIVKITKGSKIHYEVQQLKMWFFWITETYFDCCIDGSMAGYYPIEFDSVEKAEIYISKQNINTEVVCLK